MSDGKKSDFITPRPGRGSRSAPVAPVRQVNPDRPGPGVPQSVEQVEDLSTKPAPPDVDAGNDEPRSRLGRKKD